MILIVLTVAIGALIGRFTGFDFIRVETVIPFGISVMLFMVGFDISRRGSLKTAFRRLGLEIFVLPGLVGIGSIIGGILSGLVLGFAWNQGAALGSGMGWFSVTTMIIEPYSEELAAISFMMNVIREILSFLWIPFVAKHLGYLSAVALPGLGAMDIHIPILSKVTDQRTTILSFCTGALLSMVIPVLVQFFIAL